MQQSNHSMVPAIYLVMRNDDGKVLSILRSNTGYMDGYWTLPSGHVEKGELPIKGMIREAKEEIGINIKPEDLGFIHLMVRSAENITGERIDIFFEIKNWQEEPSNSEPDKHEKIEWVNVDDESINWMPYQKQALKHILNGEKYSEWRINV